MENEITFYKADTIQDLLYYIKTVNNLKLFGGGTSLHNKNKEITISIEDDCLFLSQCKECCFIDKKERYIDFGSGISLTKILNLGKSKIPEYIYKAIKSYSSDRDNSFNDNEDLYEELFECTYEGGFDSMFYQYGVGTVLRIKPKN